MATTKVHVGSVWEMAEIERLLPGQKSVVSYIVQFTSPRWFSFENQSINVKKTTITHLEQKVITKASLTSLICRLQTMEGS